MEGTTRAGKYMCVKSNKLTLGDLGVGLHLIAHFVFIFLSLPPPPLLHLLLCVSVRDHIQGLVHARQML